MRRIPLSRRSHITGFRPISGKAVEHESALERDFVTLTSFLDAGAAITSQPVTIWFGDGRPRRYTPDFWVAWSDGRLELVEVKYRADLHANWLRLRPGFVAARRWAREHGARFRIATERGIRGPLLDNAKRLLPLRSTPFDVTALNTVLSIAGNRTRAGVAATAKEIGCGVTQTYELLTRYLASPRLTSLLPSRRGRKQGRSMLSAEVDEIIRAATDETYLTRQKPKVTDLVREVRRRCRTAGLRPPSRGAIERRLLGWPAAEVIARRHGRKAARDRYAPATGSLEAPWPLSLVQIDHTLVDVIVVDSVTRAPIQRPWLTLAIDVCSRCVAGFHLSLEPPSATSVALCIAQAALPKDTWLSMRRIDAAWPVSGIPERLHLDNAKEFRSEALRRGCEQYGIAIDYRPVRTPHYGGHIERLIGTMMGKVHLLPGTTFSDVRGKGDLDPEKTAAMTLDEVERWLGHAIAGVYHRELHRGIGTTPLVAWERGIVGDEIMFGHGEPTAVPDPRRLLIDFLPIEGRLVRRDGVSLHSIRYWSDVLHTWIGHRERMIVRYDPRDLSRIYLLAPDGAYYDLPYSDLRRPPISLWEHRLAIKRLREEGRTHVDEAAIFQAIEAMRAIADDAVMASKAARRQRERRLRVIQGDRGESPRDVFRVEELDATVEPDPLQPHERMFPVEEWE